jgi:hypothetical protein
VLTEPLDGRGHLGSTPRRLASVARRLLPRLADHASPSRLLSAMLREVSLVVAEEAMRGRQLHGSGHSLGASSSSTWSGHAGGEAMSHSASWGQLTAENVQIHEERSSPVAIPELLARNGQAAAFQPVGDGSDADQASNGGAQADEQSGLAEGYDVADGHVLGEMVWEASASDGASQAGSEKSRA